MLRTDFHFDLPQELIAQTPAPTRSGSRLLALDGTARTLRDLEIRDLPSLLKPSDLLIFNDTRVIPARVFGHKSSGGRVEILLERVLAPRTALAHVRSSKGLRPGAVLQLAAETTAQMQGREGELYVLDFSTEVVAFFDTYGEVPLPPYIERSADGTDRERYQTIYARAPGAVAAPTAGLHFDEPLFAALDELGVRRAFVTLHVGAGTFSPVRVDDLDEHRMHAEYVEVMQATCDAIAATRAVGGRIIAVGTTVVRSLETAALESGVPQVFCGATTIFIKPGHRFQAVDAMLTNFHLPESTLLMLCAAFVGHEVLFDAYAHAVRGRYRFFSYGDAMFLTPAAAARVAA